MDVNEAKNNEHGSSLHRGDPCGSGAERTPAHRNDEYRNDTYTNASNVTTGTGATGTGATWTTERVDQLQKYVIAGMTCSQIAAEIGVTRNSVIGKIHRLGLSTGGKRGRRPSGLAQRMGATRAPA